MLPTQLWKSGGEGVTFIGEWRWVFAATWRVIVKRDKALTAGRRRPGPR